MKFDHRTSLTFMKPVFNFDLLNQLYQIIRKIENSTVSLDNGKTKSDG